MDDSTQQSTQRVYVVSWAPSYDEAPDGGCEWRREWEGILEMLRDAEMITAGYDYRVITLDLPANMTPDEITDFLGSGNGVDVIDPPDPRQDLDDSLRCWRENGEE